MLTLPAPAALNGEALADELTAALGRPVTVTLNGTDVEIVAPDDAPLDKAAATSVVKAHVPPTVKVESPLADRLAAVEARLDKAAAAAVTGEAAKLRDNLKPAL